MLPSRVIVASFKCSPGLPSAQPALQGGDGLDPPSDRLRGRRRAHTLILTPHATGFRLPRVHRTEHHGVRDFPAPDLEPTLEGAQKPIAIGPRIFDLQSSKQLTASSPRLRSEPCVQLLNDLRQRVRSPAASLLFRFG